MITLFPDQIDLDGRLRTAIKQHQSVLVYAPPGFGKTILAAHIINGSYRKGRRAVFVCHRKLLLEQTAKTLSKFGINYGFIADGYPRNPLANIQVATIGSIINKLDLLEFDLVICDEAHISGAPMWVKLIKHYRDHGAKIIGLSGSPERADNKPLSMNFDELVRGPDPQFLIDAGRLAKFKAYAPVVADLSGLRKSKGDYTTASLEEKFDKPSIIGDGAASWGKFARGLRTVIYCVSVEHSRHTAATYQGAGIRIEHMDGETHPNEKKRIILEFATGKIDGISSCDLLTTGFDLSSQVDMDVPIQCGQYLRPTESLPLATQMLMRPMRAQEGYAVLLDHVNLFKTHGLPSDPHEWNWRGETSGKKGSGGHVTPTTTCGDCFATFHASSNACPYCGCSKDIHGRQIEVVDGHLEEVDPDLVRQARAEEQRALNKRVQQTRGLPDLARLAVELGRDAGWVFNTYKHRPDGRKDIPYGEVVRAMAKARVDMEKQSA